MSDILRALLGGALGAGEGYFRGQDMKRQMEEDTERRDLNRRRVDLEEDRFLAAERERAEREKAAKRDNDVKVSQDFRDHFRKVSMGARHGGMLSRLMGNPEDVGARDTLLRENPQMLSQWRTDMKDREPPGPPPSRQTDRGIEEYRDGEWVVTGRTPYRAPGSGGDTAEIRAEDARRRGLVQAANQRIRELPRDIMGNPANRFMADEIAGVRDSVTSEIGAPAPGVRTNPLARFGGAAGSLPQARPIAAQPPAGRAAPVSPPAAAPATESPFSPEEASAAKAAVAGKSDAEARRLLGEAGYSAVEIAAILKAKVGQ